LNTFLGSRGASAAIGFVMLAVASSQAPAQTVAGFDIKAAVKATEAEAAAKPAAAAQPSSAPTAAATSTATASTRPAVAAPAAKVSALYTTDAAKSVTIALPPVNPAAALAAKAALPQVAAPDIAKEGAWLHRNGWGLHALVERYSASAQISNEQENCIAVAIYHEARGETVDGQLAVARVIMNRALSGKYPSSWCGVVMQPWQFSFVNPRTGQYPAVNEASAAWRKAKAITKLAVTNVVPSLSTDVLWYHADYVSPSWGRRLSFVQKIGTHIFYRA
jgi:N-acetylmuramoyl-L-alanine amidase